MTSTVTLHSGIFRAGPRVTHGDFDRSSDYRRDFPVDDPSPLATRWDLWRGYQGTTVGLWRAYYSVIDRDELEEYVQLTLTVNGQVIPVCYIEKYYDQVGSGGPSHTIYNTSHGDLMLTHLPRAYVAYGPNPGPTRDHVATWIGKPLRPVD